MRNLRGLRLVASLLLSPLVVAALVLGAVAVVLGGVWERASFTKKNRREHELAMAINRFVKLAKE